MKAAMTLLVLLALSIASVVGQSPSIKCDYGFTSSNQYTCTMAIYNPSGLNNFSEINGTHVTGMTSSDVQRIFLDGMPRNTLNFPSIICQTFKNAFTIDFVAAGIERLDADSFSNCTQLLMLILLANRINRIDENVFINNHDLRHLEFRENRITELPENLFASQQRLTFLSLYGNNVSDFHDNTFKPLKNLEHLNLASTRVTKLKHSWFEPLENLREIYIFNNQIEEFPEGIFASLKNLWIISAFSMNLTVIHSDSFGHLPRFSHIILNNNNIYAFDERFVDNTVLSNLIMERNICVNESIADHSPSRPALRNMMRTCFENYEALLNGKF